MNSNTAGREAGHGLARRHILIIQGHPDPQGTRYGRALAESYADGARAAGYDVKQIDIARLDIPMLRSKEDFDQGQLPSALVEARNALLAADHLVFFFPIWFGTMPALLKAFLEQLLRPAPAAKPDLKELQRRLKGKSGRIVVTMGMPALVYRWYFRAHGVRVLERSILGLCGVRPIRRTLIGRVETISAECRRKWISRMRQLGRSAE